MATNVILTKRGRTLVAEEALSIETLCRIKEGQTVRAVITVPRNLKHHRLLFALLNTVLKGQADPPLYPTTKALLNAIKMGTGHIEEVRDLHGRTHFMPASIDFASLDEVAFSEWFDHAVNLILQRVLPNCVRGDLEQQIYDMLHEPGPAALMR